MHALLSFLVACTDPVVPDVGHDTAPPIGSVDTAVDTAPTDTGADTDTVDTVDDAPEEPDPVVTEEGAEPQDTSDLAGWIFDQTVMHTVDITLPDLSESALASSPYMWARAGITIDGEEMAPVGVHLRGKIGSFRTLSGKPKFKISFNQYVAGQRFYGLEELSLNNSVVDCSYIKEMVGYRMYELAGIPTLRTSYAQVTVNGEPYGLYIVLETPSDKWLDRNYDDASGNLYDGKYVWYGGYSYTLLDFNIGVDSLFQLEEGTDVANADIAAISAALAASDGQPTFYDTMGAVLDWDLFHRYTSVDHFIGHNDGYSMNTNNYRVYFDPTDGKADFLPWDLDYTFLYDYEWGLSWRNANGNITNACFRDASCTAGQAAGMATVLAAWEADDWEPWLDGIEALSYAATQDDPRRECAASSVQPYRDYVRSWLEGRPNNMRAYYGL